MPPTSTPFRPPPRHNPSSRPGAGPQFASTPRFLLSQQTPGPRRTRNVAAIDTEGSSQSTPLLRSYSHSRDAQISARIHRDVIEDSDAQLNHHAPSLSPNDIEGKEAGSALGSSPPSNIHEFNSSFEELFGPTADRAKRGRSCEIESPSARRRKTDSIASSSPAPPSPTKTHLTGPYRTPQARPKPAVQRVHTERHRSSNSAKLRSSDRSQARFVLSALQGPSGSNHHATVRPSGTSTPASAGPQKKPGFVLPRSPTANADNDTATNLTPFSPSSRALRRRGRARPAAPSYLPGGMAAEVRSWVLRMGTTCDQLPRKPRHADPATPDLTRYFVAFRICSVRQSVLPSSGSLAFVQGYPVLPRDKDDSARMHLRNYLLLGTPRFHNTADSPFQHSESARVPELRSGNMIGICPGLVWTLNLPESSVEDALRGQGANLAKADTSLADAEAANPGKWLVGMQWELIS